MFDMAVECGAAINIENNQVLKSYFLKGDIHTFLGSSCDFFGFVGKEHHH